MTPILPYKNESEDVHTIITIHYGSESAES
jgi:hypothetical protein